MQNLSASAFVVKFLYMYLFFILGLSRRCKPLESFSQTLSDEKSVNRTKMDVFVVHVPLNLNSVYVGSRLSYLHLILMCVIPDTITGEA